MRTVLLGAPGSGKGTQGVVLAKKYNIPQVSTGDLLRAAVSASSTLGKKAKYAMDAGALVSDDIVIGLIKERLAESDANNGYILDGFPRNITQAEALDSVLADLNQPLQCVILLDIAFGELLQRLTGRRTCEQCGAIYNIHLSPTKIADHCDECNGNLFQRADDNEETIGNRLNVYQQQTAPLVDFYARQNKLHSIAGVGDINDIAQEVSAVFASL